MIDFMNSKRIVIIGNGFSENDFDFEKTDFVICADGGANFCEEKEIIPAVIVGDMDSISDSAKNKFSDVKKILFNREKDKTDLELAIDEAVKLNPQEILILGVNGTRADMFLNSVMLLEKIPREIDAKIIDRGNEIFLVGKHRTIIGKKGCNISLLSLSDKVEGLSLKGMKYELKNTELRRTSSLGISNEIDSDTAEISAKNGILIAVIGKY